MSNLTITPARAIGALLATCSLLAFAPQTQAQAPAQTKEIVVASVVPLTGPVSATGKPLTEGARAYFDAVNAKGGVNGYKIRFEVRDDTFDPKVTVEKTREVIASLRPIVLMNTVGTPQNLALIDSHLLDENHIALVGPRNGSATVRERKSPYHFFLIASVSAEADKILEISSVVGRKRLIVAHVDDGGGREVVKQIERAARETGSTVVAVHAIPGDLKTVPDIAKKIAETQTDYVVVYGVAPLAAAVYREISKLRPGLPVMAFSTANHKGVLDAVGAETSRGLMLTQVTLPLTSALPIIKDFFATMEKSGMTADKVNSTHLEGYLAARVVIEALRQTRGAPTREGIVHALEQIHKTNLGGVDFNFSNGRREGSDFVQIGIIGPQGRLVN